MVFNCLWLAFMKALILPHFDLKCYIWIETDISGYAIDDMLSQLASGIKPDKIIIKTNLNYWHLIAFFLRKIILWNAQHKIYNVELLALFKL